MEPQTIEARVVALQNHIFKSKYYLDLWCTALIKSNMSVETINQHEHTARELVLLCNDFWESLPDTPAIRRAPFFELCDIAENIFDSD